MLEVSYIGHGFVYGASLGLLFRSTTWWACYEFIARRCDVVRHGVKKELRRRRRRLQEGDGVMVLGGVIVMYVDPWDRKLTGDTLKRMGLLPRL